MVETVDEVGRATAAAGIDCDWAKAGTISYARSAVQLASARAEVDEATEYGVDRLELWGADRVHAAGALGAAFTPACARVHPAKLVRGLASAAEKRGVAIYEGTEVLDYESGIVRTTRGTVRCSTVVVALEGYTATLAQSPRDVLPLYSLMIATEPLPDSLWDELGIAHGNTFADFRHLLVYGQRTADNRFAFGGRGARYHWGSAIRPEYDRVDAVFRHLRATLAELFPAIGNVEVSHRWGGPLGVTRDWHATASFDPATRIARAGGYVGDGLSTTNLAGRTLADLITGTDSELVRLPWVNHGSPLWEREPLRFIGANAGLAAMSVADVEENATRRRSLVARAMGSLVGH
jgi:glycine/D-amino acid oxidase-like deaminating enzyme